ncbi:MAG TPA: flagellar protein FlgN [Tepidimicrobium sp.]|nr:flagellar protein FlgN [Tepidimicrobium sp.]
MTRKQIDELITLAKKKSELFEEMYDITKVQLKSIEDGDMDSLNRILDEKDSIMKRVDGLNLSFLNIFSSIKEHNHIEDIYQLSVDRYPNLEELKEVVGKVTAQLEAIAALDDENHKNMKKSFENTKRELKRLKRGQKAYKGYNISFVDNMFIDEKK